jgi:hypothetical protein
MNLLISHFAIPNRRALAVPERERDWLRKNLSGLIDEYQFDYSTLHPPYMAKDPRKRLTQVLHPLFVRRQLVQRANRSLTFAHVTDTHVNVRDDVYEENLRRAEQPMSWTGGSSATGGYRYVTTISTGALSASMPRPSVGLTSFS